jgi:hypothetical protein
MPNLTITVGSTNIRVASADIEGAIGMRATFSFTWEKITQGTALGLPVRVALDGQTIFRGKLADREYGPMGNKYGANASQLYLTGTCTDLSNIADRFYVTGRFISNDEITWNSGKLVRYLLTNYLAADGITEGFILDGRGIDRRSYSYRKISDVLTELADENGFLWWIDEFAQLHFADKSGLAAPWHIQQESDYYADIKVRDSLSDVRNRQIIRGGFGGFNRDESFIGKQGVGSGVQEVRVRFPIANTDADPPEMETRRTIHNDDGSTRSEWGSSEPKDHHESEGWYYAHGDTYFRTEGELVHDQKVIFHYKALVPVVTIAEDSSSIHDRIVAEGGSGIYESVIVDDSLEDIERAQREAEGLLARYSQAPRQVEYKTWKPGLKAGMIQRIDIPYLGLAGDFIIESIQGHGDNTSRRHQTPRGDRSSR